jgi:CubicO group peptidase (beta-lactamase class C family)
MPALNPSLLDATPTLRGSGPVVPLVYPTDPAAMRQRVVNYAAKRLTDMMFVTGLDEATALRHFRRKPADAPGDLTTTADDPAHAADVAAAWAAGHIRIVADAADRRVTVTWSMPGQAEVRGAAIARPGFGGIVLGDRETPAFSETRLDRPKANPALPWPLGDATPAPAASSAMRSAADALFAGSSGLYGVMAATPDGILFERYSAHGAADRPTPSWSVSKAVTATLIARMLHEGWLRDVHDPAPAPLWRDGRGIHRLITLDHLLRMRSGLGHVTVGADGTSGLGFENSFVYHNAEDAFATAQRALVATIPGSVYRYINSGINVLGAIIRDQIERRGLPYHETLYGLLADRIGMASFQHSADIAGNLIASGSGFAVLRDYARFGLLYAQDGVWNGERLLPEGWVDYALTPSHTGTAYAACFRSNADRLFPSLPADAAWGNGASDQRVIILRGQRLVVAVANETDHPMDLAALDRFCAIAMEQAATRPASLQSAAD